MGKLGRFACIFTPMALTIGSLICLILVFAGGQNKGSSLLRNLYFFKADTSGFTNNPDLVKGSEIDDRLLAAFKNATANANLKDFYTVHIWNYCSGNKTKDGVYEIDYCSGRQARFWFNPVEVWGLNNTSVSSLFPDKLNDGLKVYQKVANWMFVAYAIAFWVTAASIVVGILALFSRWGSFLTTIVSAAATVFYLAAAITSSVLYGTLAATFNTVLRPYNIDASLGRSMLSAVWIGVAFSVGASFFWLISMCCCSGHSDRPGRKRTVAEKAPYTYERVASPYLGHQDGVQMGNVSHAGPAGRPGAGAGAYEPFRHGGH